ncbi:mucin-19-like [Leucoraja erinacea]|uniref:mucin-19-like n=1 Tax=Leucoraja erinaceus TaxID=7782 RepID=UPI0024541B2F|nr:mucin-19-like [Leucoraja erinacea]
MVSGLGKVAGLRQDMGQVLGFGHCKESASTVSTTPDSTPSSTEGVSEDFLEPQTGLDLSDDDVPSDPSQYWGTPRQMSLESALSCGAPLVQAGCFPLDFAESVTEVPQGSRRQTRGLVRTETIETFLAEEREGREGRHHLPPGGEGEGDGERAGVDLAMLPCPDHQEIGQPAPVPGETDTETETGTGTQGGSKPRGAEGDREDSGGPGAGGDRSPEENGVTEVAGAVSSLPPPRVTEEKPPSPEPSLPPATETEGEEMVVAGDGGGIATLGRVPAVGWAGTPVTTLGAAGVANCREEQDWNDSNTISQRAPIWSGLVCGHWQWKGYSGWCLGTDPERDILGQPGRGT